MNQKNEEQIEAYLKERLGSNYKYIEGHHSSNLKPQDVRIAMVNNQPVLQKEIIERVRFSSDIWWGGDFCSEILLFIWIDADIVEL